MLPVRVLDAELYVKYRSAEECRQLVSCRGTNPLLDAKLCVCSVGLATCAMGLARLIDAMFLTSVTLLQSI